MPSRLTRILLPLLAAAATLTVPSVANAADVIVRYKPGTDAAERADARSAADVLHQEQLPVSGMELVTPEAGTTVAEAVATLERSSDVLYAQPDTRRQIARTPLDGSYGLQWALPKIGAPAAWDTTVGDPSLPIAVVDTGIDANHPDLKPNVWTNAGEIPGDGLDNDHDGYVDDVHGWDFVGAGLTASDPGDPDPADANGHGTHVAGTIGASGSDASNTGGVVGVAWQTSLMPLRVLDAHGSGFTSSLVKAYAYAQQKGARIVNVSLTGSEFDRAEYDAMRAAKDLLFVVAAGNGGADGIGDDNDVADTNPSDLNFQDTYPCEYDLPNIVCVAATDANDGRATFSNYGATTVDLGAPGLGILSTRMGGGWLQMNGTSMAAPHATGGAALVLAERPQLTPWQLGQVLMSGVDKVPSMAGRTVSGGRLNVAGALAAKTPATTQPAATTPTTPSTPAPVIVPVTTPPSGGTTPPSSDTTTTPTAPPATPATSAPSTPSAPAAPAAPPSSPSGSIAVVDRAAPALTLSLPVTVSMRLALTGRLKPRAGVSERSMIRLTLSTDARTAKRYRISRSIGSGSVTLTRAGSATVTVRLTSKARRVLAKARNLKATLSATATDAAGNRSTKSRRVTLR
jgi:subtilisin family serine protease